MGSVIFGTPTYSPDRWHSSQIYDNGVAGIHIVDTTDFTFEATFDTGSERGDGYVGSVDGQQPIEVIVESSQRVTFQDMDVRSANGENIFNEPIEIAHKAQIIPNRGEHKKHPKCTKPRSRSVRTKIDVSYARLRFTLKVLIASTAVHWCIFSSYLPLFVFVSCLVDPVMTVSADSSEVIFNNNGFSNVPSGTCVIQVRPTVA